jgi:hypothetical protein
MKNPISPTRTMTVFPSIMIIAFFLCGIRPVSAATDTWSSSPAGTNWNSTDWTGGNAPPQAGDSLVFASSTQTVLNNDFSALTAFNGITFAGGSVFDLNGNSVLISGSTVGNNIGVLNNSGLNQIIQTMPLVLDQGYYTFTSPSGGSMALNGGLTLNPGGVAYFDTAISSTNLTLDGTTGLISGLEGAAFMYSGGIPTGLATFNASVISAYNGYALVASGAIGNGNNIKLTASGAAGAYTASNNTVNTITVAQAGGANGADFTSTLTVTGTLTLGANGGITVLNSTGTNHADFSLSGGTLTAGTSSPATITFAVNGNNANNQASVSSTIVNNSGGGPVTVVMTGTGSMNFATTTTSSYSGGLFVNQGQLQFGQVQQIGTGPVRVAANASLYFIGTGTISNDLYLSSGTGSPTAAAVANGGALAFSGSGTETLSGAIHLLGAPVSQGTAGARISGNLSAAQTAIFSGQITGPGTLDFYVSPHAANFILSNATANLNNWQGGMIIEEVLPNPSSARNAIVKLGADNQIPSGAGAGDVTLFSADVSSLQSIVRLDLNGHNATINGLNGPSAPFPVQLNSLGTANSVLTFGANNASGNFYGVTADNGVGKALSLVKIGSGTETFYNALAHNGNTTVSNGTLALASGASLSNSPMITVASGAALDASGIGGLTVGPAQTLNCVGTVVGNTAINGTVMALDAIGTFTNNGNMAFNGGGAYVWDINNARVTAGSDPGWSLLKITGDLAINANSGSPFNIKITSLTAGDVPGNAVNFNPNVNGSWTIAQSASPITGFDPSAFHLDTSAFSNGQGGGAFGISLSGDQLNLILTFTSTPTITTQLANQTNNAGSTASFTVVAGGATHPPVTYQWLQGSTPLSNGGTSASGAAVTINSIGTTSTLSIAGVQDADAGGFTVNVSDNAGAMGTSSATLTVIDPPGGLSVTPSQNSTTPNAGSADVLTATTTSGTPPFTYQWYFGTNAIAGATSSSYTIANVSSANVGTYTVVVGNSAGSVTNNSVVITAVSEVPNQIVFEPFNYVIQPTTQSSGNPWTAFGVTNVYNQATGVGLMWVNTGTIGQEWTLAQDMRIEAGYTGGYSNYVFNPSSPAGDYYPWPGLAGNDPQEMACNSANTGVNLPLGAGGSLSNGPVYFSVILHVDQSVALTGSFFSPVQYFCGFGTGAANSTTYNTGIFISEPGDDTYVPGVFKTSGGTAALNPGVNGDWSAKHYHRGEIVFAVCRLTINPGGGSTCDLWLDPNPSTFYAGEGSVPTPDVSSAAGTAPDVGNVDFFYFKSTATPTSRRFTDLRIGTTWASVTPPSAPTLSLADVVLGPGETTAVFASHNAGNPVATYQWRFNGGSPLGDGLTGHGSTISGSTTDTLTITGATGADAGTYTVTGSNADPSGPLENGATLTGSASATLSFTPPLLSVAYSAPNLLVSWPTNFTGFTLEQTPTLSPSHWTTNSLPPYPVVGTNYTVSVNAGPGANFFRLIK